MQHNVLYFNPMKGRYTPTPSVTYHIPYVKFNKEKIILHDEHMTDIWEKEQPRSQSEVTARKDILDMRKRLPDYKAKGWNVINCVNLNEQIHNALDQYKFNTYTEFITTKI